MKRVDNLDSQHTRKNVDNCVYLGNLLFFIVLVGYDVDGYLPLSFSLKRQIL